MSLVIPEITPVRVKTEPIAQQLINPRSIGRYFPPEVGPRVVYLDERYAHPPQKGNDPHAERERQVLIWKEFQESGGVQFLDRDVERSAGGTVRDIQSGVADRLGGRESAAYFEQVFSEYFSERLNVVIIATGVSLGNGENYHDIGYLRG